MLLHCILNDKPIEIEADPTRETASDRHKEKLRRWGMRRLHRAGKWGAGQFMLVYGGQNRRKNDIHR